MHELQELKEMLCNELEEYGRKGNLSSGTLEIVDKLAHAIKNLDKIIESEGNSYMYDGRSYDGMSRKRDSMGRYADNFSRDSYSRGYSRGKGMVSELRDLMEESPDEHTRMEFEKFIKKIEKME